MYIKKFRIENLLMILEKLKEIRKKILKHDQGSSRFFAQGEGSNARLAFAKGGIFKPRGGIPKFSTKIVFLANFAGHKSVEL